MAPLEYKYLKQNPKGNTEEALFYFIYLSYEVLGKQFEDFLKKLSTVPQSNAFTVLSEIL